MCYTLEFQPRCITHGGFHSNCPLQVYLGCMVPNFLGTEFRLMDHRVNPRNATIMEYVADKGKNELGAVLYGVNVMGR